VAVATRQGRAASKLTPRLPSERTLSQQYEVSKSTVCKALNLLVTEGMVVEAPGMGF
jgi:DNA-binding GntR family transcriptional regulator